MLRAPDRSARPPIRGDEGRGRAGSPGRQRSRRPRDELPGDVARATEVLLLGALRGCVLRSLRDALDLVPHGLRTSLGGIRAQALSLRLLTAGGDRGSGGGSSLGELLAAGLLGVPLEPVARLAHQLVLGLGGRQGSADRGADREPDRAEHQRVLVERIYDPVAGAAAITSPTSPSAAGAPPGARHPLTRPAPGS